MSTHASDGGRATQRSLRRRNLAVVMRHVAEGGPQSRARIAIETGFNKSTVSSLVAELVELGLLAEQGHLRRGTVGRPGLVVDVSPRGVVALGLELNIDYLAVQATDLKGTIRYEIIEEADNRSREMEDVLDRLAWLTKTALSAVRGQGLSPIGVAVALPGLVDIESGTLLVAPNLGWTDVMLAGELRKRVGTRYLPVSVDNEANLGALAEFWEGAGAGLDDLLYVSGEIGIGAGIIIAKQLFRGHRGLGGEFGHVTVEPDGLPCACGSRGCVETRAGLEPLLRAAGINGSRPKGGMGARVSLLAERARSGDPTALDALREAGRWLGIGLGSATNLLRSQTIVLGSSYAPLAEWLGPAVEDELDARVLGARWNRPTVTASTLGPEAAARGAAMMLLHRVLADPHLVAPSQVVG